MSLPIKRSLEQWLSYIESLHAVQIDMGLTRLQQVSASLGLKTRPDAFVYMVAGTNGKGSTTAILAQLNQQAGLKVGWYSSPHLRDFNERIRINGHCCSDQELIACFEKIDRMRGDVSLSYFEFTTLAAFCIFQHNALDVWVLEVGLGGRLDAVNLIDADISVITSIGLDHQEFLGSSVLDIGREKAAIARAHCPVVLGEGVDNNDGVMEVLRRNKALIFRFGDRHGYVASDQLYCDAGVFTQSTPLSLPNNSIVCAFQAFALGLSELSLAGYWQALHSISLPGRLQCCTYKQRNIVLDVGHNPDAARYLVSSLAPVKYHIIIGMLKTKDASNFIEALSPIALSYRFIPLNVPNSYSATELRERVITDHSVSVFDTILQAIQYSSSTSPMAPLLICGSFYTVAAALDFLEGAVE